ncbi:hypothetical protein L0A91_05400 [Ornithinimicrobium sp. INDO-MA30-4]|nr:hypothetical protein [Ornithinimicrobium sp. INDO-MA30-4]UJH71238.1 hypothetical protein L0A91_05400 [Ornithinimicrobium sp. INDO-MA30-4]
MLAQAHGALGADRKLNSGAPPQTGVIAWHGLAHDIGAQQLSQVNLGQPAELLGHNLRLQLALVPQIDMLEVAAAAATGPDQGQAGWIR